MKIACLGWGSLIWKPEALPVVGDWQIDGPSLPVEFSRVGDGGELATAICIDAPLSDVCWTLLDASSLPLAVQALREREKIPAARDDGVGTLLPRKHVVGSLSKWAVSKGLDAVTWTALPPRYEGIENRIPSLEDVLAYLESLTGRCATTQNVTLSKCPRR